MWLCPLCRFPLSIRKRSWVCEQQHSFDMAKQGYVNLLPVQQKKSKSPGDNKLMIQARQRFLNSGAYEPLVSAIVTALKSLTQTSLLSDNNINAKETNTLRHNNESSAQARSKLRTLFEAGCGEGYYTRQLAQRLPDCDMIAGNDISKDGVLSAAKQGRQFISNLKAMHDTTLNAQYVVGNSFALPVADNSMDLVLQIFAPAADEELFRILALDGLLIEVQPNTQHLQELKAKLFAQADPHIPKIKPIGQKVYQTYCQYTLPLNSTLTEDLILMTPLAFSSTPEKKAQAILTLEQVTVDFCITFYQKKQEDNTDDGSHTLSSQNAKAGVAPYV